MTERRVLLVLGRSAGGIARHVAQVTELLDGRSGLAIDIAGPRDLPIPMPKQPIEVHIPSGPIVGHRAAVARLRSIVADGGYELVHAHGLRASIDAGLAGRRLRVPVLSTVHNLVRPEIAGRMKAPLYRRAEGLAVRVTGKTFAVSEEIARHLRARVPSQAEKVEVLYLGIGDAPAVRRGRDEVRAELGLDPATPLVVTAARLAAQKALHVMVAAVARCRTDPVLAIVGEGPLRAELESLAAGVAPGRVRLLGWRDDVADFVAAADAFCLSSVWEGVPLAAQEAILLGTPVVATRVGGMPELVADGESGRLVPGGDADALALSLDEVVSDADLAHAYAGKANALLAARFSTSAMAARLEAAYLTSARLD
ncbi:MAG TPA: glycosyltransferase family 4 protein [Actinomycetota bacterium]|jgi:glycosyltransferase involved in cell wall biosynthesis